MCENCETVIMPPQARKTNTFKTEYGDSFPSTMDHNGTTCCGCTQSCTHHQRVVVITTVFTCFLWWQYRLRALPFSKSFYSEPILLKFCREAPKNGDKWAGGYYDKNLVYFCLKNFSTISHHHSAAINTHKHCNISNMSSFLYQYVRGCSAL